MQCKESCDDFNAGCYHEFTREQSVSGDAKFNVSCTSLSNRTDPEGKPCYYEPVVCSAKPDISSHEKTSHQNGSTVWKADGRDTFNLIINLRSAG